MSETQRVAMEEIQNMKRRRWWERKGKVMKTRAEESGD